MNALRRAALVLAAVLAARFVGAVPCSACPNASFGPSARSISLPGTHAAMVRGDFDGDGIQDVVVSGEKLYFLRGLSSGDFAAPALLSANTGGSTIVAGDLDGDGHLDLVMGGSGVNVLWGNGDGTFSSPVLLANGYGGSVALGDVNNDGRLDIVETTQVFSVHLNLGGRAFEVPVNYGTYGTRVLLGDFDGDGNLDVAIGAPVQIFRGVGNGTFPDPPIVDGSTGYAEIAAVADLNRDGKPDLVVFGPDVSVMYGRGDGTFDAPVSIAPVGPAPLASAHQVEIFDWNGDGWPDVVAGYGTLVIALSDRHGGFQPPLTYAAASNSILVVDFDGDGLADVLMTKSDTSDLLVLRGTPTGGLEMAPAIPASSRPWGVVRGHFGGGPGDDVALLDPLGIHVWRSDGSGGFTAGPSISIANQTGFVTGDFNGDGLPDFVTLELPFVLTAVSTLHVFLGAAGGTFVALPSFDVSFRASSMWTGDLDGDSKTDLLLTSSASSASDFGLRMLKGAGDGTFATGPTSAPGVSLQEFVVRDLNGDGLPDVAASSGVSGPISVLLGHGDGSFGPVSQYVAQGYSLVAEDFDGDGHIDIVTNAHLTILRGHGDGTFDPALYFPSVPFGFGLAALDYDGDGKADVAMGVVGPDLVVFRGMGDGTFQPSASIPSINSRFQTFVLQVVGPVLVGDWNGDGRPDVGFVTDTGVTAVMNTGCLPRRLRPSAQPATCAVSGASLAGSPTVSAYDDGNNPVSCAAGAVTASIAAFTGAPGATLSGTLAKPLVSGVATFSNLSIDLPHAGYRLDFRHPSGAAARSSPFSVHASGAEPVFAPSVACASSAGNVASVGDRGAGTTYAWTVGNGTITSGQGTPAITFTAGASGSVSIDVVVTEPGSCAASGSRSVPVAAACGLGFFALPPCRVADTRSAEGPAITAGSLRSFAVGGRCGVPAGAASVALNVAVTGGSAGGNLTLYPSGAAAPATSTINYGAGQTRSNNAVLPLGTAGQVGVQCNQPSGSVHLILDVTGYFQ